MQEGEVITRAEWSDEERAAIIGEMERILVDPAFKSSKRCQALFRKLIEHALAGDHNGIKERTLGIEVFGRDADYDTAADPVVRITANEIRKRLGQWYQEPDRHHLVRIRLIAGTYLPKFDFGHNEYSREPNQVKPLEEASVPLLSPSNHLAHIEHERLVNLVAHKRKTRWILAGAAILAIAVAVLAVRHTDLFSSREYLLWKPLLNSSAPLTLCISDADPLVSVDPRGNTQWQIIANVIATREVPKPAYPANPTPTTPLVDADVAHKLTSWLAMHGRRTALRASSEINVPDFRQGPVVVIGAFNPWNLILVSNLRYSVRVDPATHDKWIQDSQNPSKRDWISPGAIEHTEVDYAVISRFSDTETGQWVIALGGLWPYGTEAASDLLTNPSYAGLIPAGLGSQKNFQIVLRTSVINGSAGPPQILAVYAW